MSAWRHTYPHARDYGQPWGLVQPGQIVDGPQPPEPAFFEAVSSGAPPAAPVRPAAVPVPAPTVIPIGPPAS